MIQSVLFHTRLVFQPPPAQTMVQALELLFALGGKPVFSFLIGDFVKPVDFFFPLISFFKS